MTTRNPFGPAIAALALLSLTQSSTFAQNTGQAPVDSQPIPIAPSSTTPIPIPPVAPPSMATSPNEINASARDARTLNEVLNPTDSGISEAFQTGRAIGKSSQDFIDVLTPGRRAFSFRRGGLLGEVRRETGVVVWMTPGLEARWRGFLEQRQFATNTVRDADFSMVRDRVIAPQRTLTFLVEIADLLPKPKDKTIAPDPAEALKVVTGTHFVLSDDKDNNYTPMDDSTAPRVISRQTFYDTIASVPDRVLTANNLDAVPTEPTQPSGIQLVKRRTGYDDLGAFYLVTFDAFNPDGTARVNRDTKSMTLRIILPDGPKFATFELNRLP